MIRTKYTCILLLLTFLVSCSTIPDSDYYESDGILSIKTGAESAPPGWFAEPLDLTHSLVYRGQINEHDPSFQFRFYLQNPGTYRLSLLSAYLSEESAENVSITISGPDGFLAGSVSMAPPVSRIPYWISIGSTGEPASVSLEKPGIYTIRISHAARSGLVIDALQLTLNNEHPPEGMGYPETRQPDSEPRFKKREQVVAIPPSTAFGVIADSAVMDEITGTVPDERLEEVLIRTHGSEPGSVSRLEHLKNSFIESIEREDDRGFVLHPASGIGNPEFKKYPALWFTGGLTEFEELQRQLTYLSDPSIPAYEIPFFAPMPEWLTDNKDSDSESEVTGELLLRWVQLSMLSPVMVLPLNERDQVDRLADRDRADIREAVRLRRNLFPFIYSYTLRARTSGVRTVTAADSHDGAIRYGEELFAVPVSASGTDRLPVHFPEGDWYSWWDGQRFEGGQTWLIDVFRNRLPLFVKAGSIIPQRTEGLPVNRDTNETLTVDVFAGGVSSFRLYEDDGTTLDYREGEFSTTAFRWFEQEGRATFNIGAMVWGRGEEYRTDTRYLLRFRYLRPPLGVTANGDELSEGMDTGEWYYDEQLQAVVLDWKQSSSRRTEFEFVW
ncbi:DUF5110 domain-containing protein [Rhodohalobacter mucosus]|uniref:Uncharacterized protein n=1 Tax=Rhodohalobacter mucosus TaxID=2079485 RepID=A0A316TTM7_9BACT|nr:DUF5110 domain-containing protein [Rhodohalobacter mucosus]PWN06981.1 hypothetical protein DDZ15_06830 [Rhodohalobacter mucosus]